MSDAAALEGEVAPRLCLKIHLQFITSRCVATRVDDRKRPEWPPHPGRLYMALAAAHFETGGEDDEKAGERRTLDWLAALSAPRILCRAAQERRRITVYVPVNDALQPNKAMLQSAPGMPRHRAERYFPTVIPDRMYEPDCAAPDVSFEWPNTPDLPEHLPALERLCRQVIRVGHSSSFVMAWCEASELTAAGAVWEPTSSGAELTCRVAVAGELSRLEAACRADRINLFGDLKTEIESSSGKVQKAAKTRFQAAFGVPFKSSLRPPEPTPASLGVWQGYRNPGVHAERAVHENAYFERDLLILTKLDGPSLNVERTLGLTQALRAALIAAHGDAAIPAWLCGHDADGSPTSAPHAAFLGLPFAGYSQADGHLMGLAIALPKGIPAAERGRWLGPLLIDQQTGEAATPPLKLWAQDLPDWTLQLEERPSPPLILQNETWTKPSTTWASVTPVVLDRFPKSSRGDDRRTWHAEVVDIIRVSCIRAGLPEPIEVDVDSTAWHTGVPRAWAKTRRIPGACGESTRAPLGEGFPSLPSKKSRPAKPQMHVWLRFDRRVSGPVLIGAARFQGYGLCKPITARGAAT